MKHPAGAVGFMRRVCPDHISVRLICCQVISSRSSRELLVLDSKTNFGTGYFADEIGPNNGFNNSYASAGKCHKSPTLFLHFPSA